MADHKSTLSVPPMIEFYVCVCVRVVRLPILQQIFIRFSYIYCIGRECISVTCHESNKSSNNKSKK